MCLCRFEYKKQIIMQLDVNQHEHVLILNSHGLKVAKLVVGSSDI